MSKTKRRRIRKNPTKRMSGGKAGFLHRVLPINNDANILGAGSFGLVASNPQITVKLFYDLNDCKAVRKKSNLVSCKK